MSGTFIEVIRHTEHQNELWQWDTGRQIKITPGENAIVDEVHFSNAYSKDALVVKPQVNEQGNIVADIPNILLWQVFPINVYVVMEFPNGKGTIYEEQLKINSRKKPSDYVYTETEILNYLDLEKRIKALEENGTGGGIVKETDPTVPEWAKQPTKPSYTADEVGAVSKEKVDEQIKQSVKEALTEAKESGEFDGKDGADGKDGTDGKTPYIDEDGYVVYDPETAPNTSVRYIEQTLTEEQKEQARKNIGAASKEELENIPSGGGGSGSGSEYPKKIFEYEWKDNYDKVNVTAIDFENGILTLDSMPSQITDDFDTTVRIFPVLLIEGQQTFEYGFAPKEIISTADFYYAIKVGENQIKLQRNTTVLEVLTDSGKIDLTRWQFYVEKTRNKAQSEATVENLEIGHKYRVRLYMPHSSHFTAGVNLKDEKDINYGSQYNRGFGSATVGIKLIKLDAYVSPIANQYETISLRTVVSDTENACLKFPRVFLADITTVNENVNFVESVISYFAPLNAINSLTPNSKFSNLNLKHTIYIPRRIAKIVSTSGTGKYILDGAKFEVLDYGEVI